MKQIEINLQQQLRELSDQLVLADSQLEQLRLFYNQLVEWNKVMNLTTITEEKDVYEKHFLDSLSILKLFSPKDFSGKKLIDVGTGAGFPGLVLAIALPDLQVTLMDSLNKRIHFLDDTIGKLSLHNVETIHARAEELAKNKQYRERYDFVVSRAVANLCTLCEYDLPFVKTGGSFVSYKSEKADEELAGAKKAVQVLGGKIERSEKFYLPQTSYMRCLIQIDKIKATPAKYPRKAGTPLKEPL